MNRKNKNDYLIEALVLDPHYDIREDGSIWTYKSGNGTVKSFLRPVKFTRSNGYRGFCYKKTFILLHRIIYRKFIGLLTPGLVINHKDGVRDNNSLENLELVTYSENTLHAYRELPRNKPDMAGVKNHRAKFTKSQVDEIRKVFDNKLMNVSQLSKEYNVCELTMRNIVYRKTYI